MRFQIVYERSVNVLASTLAMVAQRLPFLKNLTPIFGTPAGVNFSAPMAVSFVGTHALSGQSILIRPVNGATNPAVGKVGEDFLWGFKASRHALRSVKVEVGGVEETPPGLAIAGGQGGVFFFTGKPTEAGEMTVTITGYRFANQGGNATEAYELVLNVVPGENAPPPFENFVTTFWTGSELDDPRFVAPTADPDADGIQNVLEFLLDLDPTKPSTMPGTIGIDPEDPTKIRYQIPLNAEATDVSVQLQQSAGLNDDWVDVPEAAITQTAELISVNTPSDVKKFFRLKVELLEKE